MNYIFVTKWIRQRDWDEYYSQNPVYTPISKVKGGYRVGFLVIGNRVPVGCIEASDEDLKRIKVCREEENNYPRP